LAILTGLVGAVPAQGQFITPLTSSNAQVGGGGLGGGGFTSGGGLTGGGFMSAGGLSGLGGGGGSLTGAGLGSSGFLQGTNAFLNTGGRITPMTQGSSTTFNPFRGYYANPFAQGWPAANAQNLAFGQPLYGTLIQVTTSGVGGGSAIVGLGRGTVTFTPIPPSTATGVPRRLPAYATEIGFEYDPPSSAQIQGELQDVIDRSASLRSPNRIRVVMEGPAVVLKGTVVSDRERRLAESLVRLTPGVHEVRNELIVVPDATSSRGRR
jgi:hypothetical protein